MEFIEGAARLKGHAKALDIWRMETKVEATGRDCKLGEPPNSAEVWFGPNREHLNMPQS